MRWKRTLAVILTAIFGLTGCSGAADHVDNAVPSETQENTVHNSSSSSWDDSIWTDSRIHWPSVGWTLKEKVSDKWNQILPQYNETLDMNKKFLTGRQAHPERYQYNTWRLPESWAPYLLKNTPRTTETGQPRVTKPYLHITLQGVVYLEPYNNGLVLPMADIPADATIVAEYVPLVPAIKAGIVPVWHGQEGVFPEVWQKATHMTGEEVTGYLQ